LIVKERTFKPGTIAVPQFSHAVFLAFFPLTLIDLSIKIFALALTVEEIIYPPTLVGGAIFIYMFSIATFFVLDESSGIVGAIL
jgi:hypothetical protein